MCKDLRPWFQEALVWSPVLPLRSYMILGNSPNFAVLPFLHMYMGVDKNSTTWDLNGFMRIQFLTHRKDFINVGSGHYQYVLGSVLWMQALKREVMVSVFMLRAWHVPVSLYCIIHSSTFLCFAVKRARLQKTTLPGSFPNWLPARFRQRKVQRRDWAWKASGDLLLG